MLFIDDILFIFIVDGLTDKREVESIKKAKKEEELAKKVARQQKREIQDELRTANEKIKLFKFKEVVEDSDDEELSIDLIARLLSGGGWTEDDLRDIVDVNSSISYASHSDDGGTSESIVAKGPEPMIEQGSEPMIQKELEPMVEKGPEPMIEKLLTASASTSERRKSSKKKRDVSRTQLETSATNFQISRQVRNASRPERPEMSSHFQEDEVSNELRSRLLNSPGRPRQ